MDSDAKALSQLAEQFQEVKAIGIISNDLPAFIPAGGDVITAARALDAPERVP